MKQIIELSEDDIAAACVEYLERHYHVSDPDITLHSEAAMQDGPHHTPARFWATAEGAIEKKAPRE